MGILIKSSPCVLFVVMSFLLRRLSGAKVCIVSILFTVVTFVELLILFSGVVLSLVEVSVKLPDAPYQTPTTAVIAIMMTNGMCYKTRT